MLLAFAQSMVFIWHPTRDVPMWRGYLVAWKQTFSLARKAVAFLFVIQDEKDAREAILVLVWMVLCVPGFFVLCDALRLLK